MKKDIIILTVLSVLLCSFGAGSVQDDLVSVFKGNLTDEMGNVAAVNNGTSLNTAESYSGKGYYFKGSELDYIDVASLSSTLVYPYTVSVWVRWNSTSTRMYVWGMGNTGEAGNKENYGIDSSNVMNLRQNSGDWASWVNLVGVDSINQNTWQNLVGVFEQTNFSIYLNGTLQNSISGEAKADFNTAIFGAVHRDAWENPQFYTGYMDEMYVWNRSLTTAEIEQVAGGWIYNTTSGGGGGLADWEPNCSAVNCYDSDYDSKAGVNIIFADMNNGNCTNWSRNTAMSGKSPWCGLKGNEDKLTAGDKLLFLDGDYNTNQTQITFQTKTYATAVELRPYANNETVIFSNYIPEFRTPGHSLWTQIDAGSNTWAAYVNAQRDCTIAYANHTPILAYDSVDHIKTTGDSYYPNGLYCSSTGNNITARFPFGVNPNNVSLYVTAYPYSFLYFEDVNRFKITNITFLHTTCIQMKNGDNFIISGINKTGGTKYGILVETGSDNLIVKDSYFNKEVPSNWFWGTVKNVATREESTAVFMNYVTGSNNVIQDNEVWNYFNGVMVQTNSISQSIGTNITGNYFRNIYDDGIEIESYCHDLYIANNDIYDCFVGISLSPTIGDNCIIEKNQLIANKLVDYNADTVWQGEAFKVMGGQTWVNANGGFHATNILIDHNTIVGQGIRTTSARYNIFKNVTITNNIFYSEDDLLLIKTGSSDDNTDYDYNLYWRDDGGDVWTYYNDDFDSSSFSLLGDLLISGHYDGWDIHSRQLDPFIEHQTYLMRKDSEGCTMSNTGSYVGAKACYPFNSTHNEPEPIDEPDQPIGGSGGGLLDDYDQDKEYINAPYVNLIYNYLINPTEENAYLLWTRFSLGWDPENNRFVGYQYYLEEIKLSLKTESLGTTIKKVWEIYVIGVPLDVINNEK